ncbi:undecaprenyl-diphosphate phosphatase [Clostridium algidicarnis]|uniref:Undecaprenyl-diphosphatase n=2 Tax=Clostridium algidicarnis TaxID=37659 RepID=A0A2S6FZN7_9CLOT|nr:undecaprenyl-diphosphate phosphatase [Clostridium algidicarnis]MBB6631608.1 undecaprenyl-diphosphate phosphatase [Clostridium algidicarnis]MBB6697963.1 undecaprenyl-diphosphate phosphatase [Clostridium algidicarnis]MBU3194108.1 undecaprenyl-diphosphate phosphatase [Clostridium algidicarnis]MBU3195164.1 undecaprenyl-diphosphate phosphatase [Clostridium algidicarnis]MBU3203646.1 undecaprenyl-diphosphate phosphatase [Clostridium algidicarnis]
MLIIFKAIIIAIVEGITEFLPISSTGHMILVGDLIKFNGSDFSDMYEVVIQLGAILAVVVLYWAKIREMIVSFFKFEKKGIRFWLNIIVATIPAMIMGFALNKIIKQYLFNSKTVIIGFVVGGILLIVIENNFRKRENSNTVVRKLEDISYGQAFKVGLFQCLAMWPGMSRSASTIMGGWVAGLSTTVATEFSFFLAIPVMIGASGLELKKFDFSSVAANEKIALAVGFVVAFITALLVVDRFIAFLKKKPMRTFAIYRLSVAAIFIILVALNVIK